MDNVVAASDLGLIRSSRMGRSVVLGTGCFDILHAGHLYFLREASRQGDLLVVGINSDNAVRAIKGSSRPIIKQEQRVALVAALRCVDLVFIDDNVVADGCILKLKPDVYAIGEESIEGYPTELVAARRIGARVHIVDRIPEVSTTSVITEILCKNRA